MPNSPSLSGQPYPWLDGVHYPILSADLIQFTDQHSTTLNGRSQLFSPTIGYLSIYSRLLVFIPSHQLHIT